MACSKHQLSSSLGIITPKEKCDFSIQEAKNLLGINFTNWNNYTDPRSYCLPQVFYSTIPEVSEEAIDILQKSTTGRKRPPEIIHRDSDEAECIVYDALKQLIIDEVHNFGPLIAIGNFDISKFKTRREMQILVPGHNWTELPEKLIKMKTILNAKKCSELTMGELKEELPNCFREYDFILIGPKIGIVNIEVKSNNFQIEGNFDGEDDGFLPVKYKEGVTQLETVHLLVYLLQLCTSITMPRDWDWDWRCGHCVKKILFAPNMEKYKEQFEKLSTSHRANVLSRTSDVEQLFKEDLKNLPEDAQKPQLYSSLKRCLRNCLPISIDLFEAYAPFLMALASKGAEKGGFCWKSYFSEVEILSSIHESVKSHNPLRGMKRQRLEPASLLEKVPEEIRKLLKISFWTSDQVKVINNSDLRKFIIGLPGTGKTVMFQAMISGLPRDKSILILAPLSFLQNYEAFMDALGFKNFDVRDLWKETFMTETPEQFKNISYRKKTLRLSELEKILGNLVKCYENSKFYQRIKDYDYIIIDDVFDEINSEMYFGHGTKLWFGPLVLMKFAKQFWPNKNVWIAGNPIKDVLPIEDIWMPRSGNPRYDRGTSRYFEYGQIVTDLLLKGSPDFSVLTLRQVMRCTENIFKFVYPQLNCPKQELKPVAGHKVAGPNVRILLSRHYPTLIEAEKDLRKSLETEIKDLQQKGIDFRKVAIIINTINSILDLEKHGDIHIANCLKVSSSEWHTVIYISFFPLDFGNRKKYTVEYADYKRARGITRVTTMLSIINVTYDLAAIPFA